MQVRGLRATFDALGYEYPPKHAIYESKKTAFRLENISDDPVTAQMVADIKAGVIRGVCLYNVSRFFRNTRLGQNLLRELSLIPTKPALRFCNAPIEQIPANGSWIYATNDGMR